MVEKEDGKIEVLKFRKGFGTGKNRGLKRKGRKKRKDKLKEQLMKHYGFTLKDN